MSNDCDICGLSDTDCTCYVLELEERISFLEEEMDKLTTIVKKIHDYIVEVKDGPNIYRRLKNEDGTVKYPNLEPIE